MQEYIQGKQTYKQLALKYNCSIKTIQRKINFTKIQYETTFSSVANPSDKKLTVKILDAYLQTKVPEITQKYKGTAQYPASYGYGNDFPILIVQ